MRWDDRVHRRSGISGLRNSRLPFSSRIILGALAIALIALAFVLRPGQVSQDSAPTVAVNPTVTTASVAAVPRATPPAAATAVPTAAAPAAAATERVHTVKSGDTLTSIAKQYYGDASNWQKILDANKDILKSPNSLQVGQKLKIP